MILASGGALGGPLGALSGRFPGLLGLLGAILDRLGAVWACIEAILSRRDGLLDPQGAQGAKTVDFHTFSYVFGLQKRGGGTLVGGCGVAPVGGLGGRHNNVMQCNM